MEVETLQTLSWIAFIIAGVLFLLCIALFFLLDVPKLYGDISGRTAKKAIEAIRQQNEATGNKAYKPSAVNEARGKLTDKITPSGRLEPQTAGMPISVGTEKLSTTLLEPQANETTLLDNSAGETTILAETILLDQGLSEQPKVKNQNSKEQGASESDFSIESELSFTESSEIIE